jgi:hypothetical protein
MATRDDDAGGEPLQILFPWSGKRLVEVVDVENDVALRRGKTPKFSRWASPQACTLSPVFGV